MHADQELVNDVIASIGEVATGTPGASLPHPATTNQLLHEHLVALSSHPATDGTIEAMPEVDEPSAARRFAGRVQHAAIHPAQKAFSRLVVHALHQLDHRSRRTEVELAAARADIAALQATVASLRDQLANSMSGQAPNEPPGNRPS